MLPSSGILSTISLLIVVPSLKQPSVLGATIASGLGASVFVPANEPTTLTADVVGGSTVPLTLSVGGKEQVACAPTSDDFEDSYSEPPAPPT